MTLIECPDCQKAVDIDSITVRKESRGMELVVKCTHCGTDFLVENVVEVRRKLKIASYGYAHDADGNEIRIKL